MPGRANAEVMPLSGQIGTIISRLTGASRFPNRRPAAMGNTAPHAPRLLLSRSLARLQRPADEGIISINRSAFHYKINLSHHGNILERIARNSDDVGQLPRLDCT